MLKLIPTHGHSPNILEICTLLIRYRELIFSENQNPVGVFLENLENNKIKVISAFNNGEFMAFLVLYDFKEIAKGRFVCYIYGAAKRGFSGEIEHGFKVIFESLKSQGCVSLRLETRKFNMPMRMLARRLGFRKVGILANASILNNKFVDNILYEKVFY